jgi:type IV pilus assembly protein PilQ
MKKALVLLLLVVFLVPSISIGQTVKQATQRVSFDFIDADIRNVLRVLSELGTKNIVVAEDVKGKVTIKLENVPLEEAFDVILKSNDLAKIEEENVTRIVTVKKLNDEKDRETKQRLDFLKEKEAKDKAEEEFVTETVFVNYADVTDVAKMIKGEAVSTSLPGTSNPIPGASPPPAAPTTGAPTAASRGLLTPNGVVTVVPWNSALIIHDRKDTVAAVVKLIKEHDVPPVQVQIEARIVQATSTFSKELGVQWGMNAGGSLFGKPLNVSGQQVVTTSGSNSSSGSGTSSVTATPTVGNYGLRGGAIAFPYAVNLQAPDVAAGSGGALGLFLGGVNDSFQLDVVLSALEANGKGKIISNPKVITSENRPAKISQGTQIPYQSSSGNLGTNIQFISADLSLEVTPHVVKDGNIRLTITAKKDQPNFDPRFTAGAPGIDTKEASTELLIKDGQTVVIGGIYEVTKNDNTNGIPLLQSIPLLGWLFKNNVKTDNKTELLVFVTPTILKNLYAEQRDK